MRDRLQKQDLADWQVSSAGTWALDGRAASTFSVELMAEQGIDISLHLSRPIEARLMSEADLVLCMESGHVEALRAEFPRYAGKIFLLSEMAGPPYSVSDPYGGPRSGYEQMVREVSTLIDTGLPRILELAKANAVTSPE